MGRPKKKWLVEIRKAEKAIYVFRDDAALLQHVRGNQPFLVGSLELHQMDEENVRDEFHLKPDGRVFGPIDLDTYCGEKDL